MSNPIRCYSTNTAIGEYYSAYMAIRDHLNKNPPADGEKQIVDYLRDFGIILYPEIMRITTNSRFIDAHLINKPPQKNDI
jgi:DNA-directed RNA polymerase subunit N (RpoN/RPB10)